MCFDKEESSKSKREHEKKPKIACLGLTYKPDIDDLRESPALYIVKTLIKKGITFYLLSQILKKLRD